MKRKTAPAVLTDEEVAERDRQREQWRIERAQNEAVWREQAKQRDAEEHGAWEKIHKLDKQLFEDAPVELNKWLWRKRQKMILDQLTDQLLAARKKGSKKTLVPLETLADVIHMASWSGEGWMSQDG